MSSLRVKVAALLALTAVQVVVATLFKASQVGGKYTFSPASAMTLVEACKLAISAALLVRECWRASAGALTVAGAVPVAWASLRRQLDRHLVRAVLVLAGTYALNNQITFAAFRVADGASVNLFKSMTALASAVLWTTVMRRPIARLQWVALLVQVCGLVTVQYDSCAGAPRLAASSYLLLAAMVAISAGAGVWNERVVKRDDVSVHVPNILMYACGVVLNLAAYLAMARVGEASGAGGFFAGHTVVSLGLVVCQSTVGLVVVAVYKYADAVVKTLASSCASALLMLLNFAVWGWEPSVVIVAGCGTVFGVAFIYMTAPTARPAPLLPTVGDGSVAAKAGAAPAVVAGAVSAWRTSRTLIGAGLLAGTAAGMLLGAAVRA